MKTDKEIILEEVREHIQKLVDERQCLLKRIKKIENDINELCKKHNLSGKIWLASSK